MTEDDKELLTADERADVLNAINDTLDELGFDLVVAGYDDSNGVTFKVLLQRKEE